MKIHSSATGLNLDPVVEKPKARTVYRQKYHLTFIPITNKQDTKAVLRFLMKGINEKGKPGLVNIDQSGANKAGLNQ